MELYWKAAAGVLLAVIMILTLRRQELGALLGITVCAMACLAALEYLRPVTELLQDLCEMSGLDDALVGTLLKSAGIGLITEIACLVCNDSGSTSLGKTLQLMGTAVILWMSVPLFHTLLEMIREILGAL